MSDKENVIEVGSSTGWDQRVVNTRRLQIFELNFFMASELHAIFDGVGFTDYEFGRQYSFEQAVKRFNERDDKDEGVNLLDSVKLRYSKKSQKITCSSHKVKPTYAFKKECEEDGIEPFSALYGIMKALRLR